MLIIDENETERRRTASRLGAVWPFERDLAVDYAADGAEALAKVQQARYALLVVNWNLPRRGGDEALRLVRQGGRRIPTVVLSRLERQHILEDLESFGAAFLHQDELNPDTLREAIAGSIRLLGFPAPPPAPA